MMVLSSCNATFEVGIEPAVYPTPKDTNPVIIQFDSVSQDILAPLFSVDEVLLYRSVTDFDNTVATLQNNLISSGWVLVEETSLILPLSGTTLRFADEDDGIIDITVVSSDHEVLVALPGVETVVPIPTMTTSFTNTIGNYTIPLIADAFDVIQRDNNIEYRTKTMLDFVVVFYQTELRAATWHVNSQIIEDQSANLIYIRQDTVMQINITPDTRSEELIISITIR